MLEPGDIFAEIEACPPLMRTQTKAVYIGREVDWTLTFADGYEDRPGYARVMFHYQPHEVKFIAMGVPLADYPWLRPTHPGEVIRVRGRIADIGTLSIELQEASLMQLAEAAH